jgi:hypothetical protein
MAVGGAEPSAWARFLREWCRRPPSRFLTTLRTKRLGNLSHAAPIQHYRPVSSADAEIISSLLFGVRVATK